jgi:ribosomal-protein-alanine N-acetyltransferase
MLLSLYTTRMIAQPLCLADTQDVREIDADAAVMRFLGGIRDSEGTKTWFEENLKHWKTHEFGIWVFRELDSGELVGRCGLRFARVESVTEVELAYAVASRYWGQGLATEMGKRILNVGFGDLGLENVIALVDEANLPSRRVAERLGFEFERNAMWKSELVTLSRLRRAKWEGMQ